MFLEKALNVLLRAVHVFLEHLLKERCLCTFVQFSIWNGVYAVCRSTFWIAERACFLCWSCPGGWCCHSICPQGLLQSKVSKQSKYFNIIKVFVHRTSFKAIKVFKNNQIISSPHQCQGWWCCQRWRDNHRHKSGSPPSWRSSRWAWLCDLDIGYYIICYIIYQIIYFI